MKLLTSLFIINTLLSSACLAADMNARQCDPFPGNPPICPRWAYEPWVWEDNVNTQVSTEELANNYLSRGIPVGAVIIDSPWSTAYNNFIWDTKRYPQPKKMIDGLHAKGVKVIMWMTGFVNKDSEDTLHKKSPDYEIAKAKNYGVCNSMDFKWWKGTGIHVDFTSPNAKTWFNGLLDRVLYIGIDGWKMDEGANYLTDTVQTSKGAIPKLEFKRYYFAGVIDHTLTRNPNAISMTRAYCYQGGFEAPISKCTVAWPGDNSGTWQGFVQQIGDIYTSARCGYGVLTTEVGGYFNEKPGKKLFIRWAQFGSMTPVMENGGINGGDSNHLPWFHGDDAVCIYRYYATLHSELVPYLFSYGVTAHLKGQSIIRNADTQKAQHLLGDDIFISALTADNDTKTVSLPSKGRWIDYWNDKNIYKSKEEINYTAPIDKYPIFIKAGAIIPMNVKNSLTAHGDESSSGKLTILIYPSGKSSAMYHMPKADGTEYSDMKISVDESKGSIHIVGKTKADYRLRVKSFIAPKRVEGSSKWSYDENSHFVVIDCAGNKVALTIDKLRGYGLD